MISLLFWPKVITLNGFYCILFYKVNLAIFWSDAHFSSKMFWNHMTQSKEIKIIFDFNQEFYILLASDKNLKIEWNIEKVFFACFNSILSQKNLFLDFCLVFTDNLPFPENKRLDRIRKDQESYYLNCIFLIL